MIMKFLIKYRIFLLELRDCVGERLFFGIDEAEFFVISLLILLNLLLNLKKLLLGLNEHTLPFLLSDFELLLVKAPLIFEIRESYQLFLLFICEDVVLLFEMKNLFLLLFKVALKSFDIVLLLGHMHLADIKKRHLVFVGSFIIH